MVRGRFYLVPEAAQSPCGSGRSEVEREAQRASGSRLRLRHSKVWSRQAGLKFSPLFFIGCDGEQRTKEPKAPTPSSQTAKSGQPNNRKTFGIRRVGHPSNPISTFPTFPQGHAPPIHLCIVDRPHELHENNDDKIGLGDGK